VYLSDGGHFENLALYEMVLRRARTIVLLDSGCDPDFTYEDLGNALRKIRIDFGIEIEFQTVAKDSRCAVGTIWYSKVDPGGQNGRLLYIKPVLLGNEPPDVTSYWRSSGTFPHETTADQWFSESQTESYRNLGCFAMDQIADGFEGGTLEEFIDHVERSQRLVRSAGATI
jgi:hypothetical protein